MTVVTLPPFAEDVVASLPVPSRDEKKKDICTFPNDSSLCQCN